MIELLEKNIAFHVTDEAICKKLQTHKDSDVFMRALALIKNVTNIIKPAYIVKGVPVGEISEEGVDISGQFFSSKIVASKIKGCRNAIVFIVTCGSDIRQYLKEISDPLDNYIVDQLAYVGCLNAREHMLKTLSETYQIDSFISLSPGSIIDWSVSDVKKLFIIMEGLYQQLGLRVLDSGLIDPLKSVSGLIIQSDEEFECCDLCMRFNCPSRKTLFNQEKYDEAMNL